MRTLKKALCLVLVLAMVFTLAVPAMAAYEDAEKIENIEAVDVLTAIGVLHGNGDGTFGPEGTFTRAQAATMITYMLLGETIADALPAGSTQFSDVPASHWASKYVQYCANEGIIAGYGNGKFGPNDTLTTSQWALMLLGALGYEASNESIGGAGWEIQVTKLAMKAGVASADELTATFNRDVAAKMAYNTLKADVVEYAVGGTTITVGNTTINTGNSKAEAVTSTNSGTIVDENANDNTKLDTVQFAEQHFPKLKLTTASTTDAYGRPAHEWGNGTTTIGTYANSAVLTLTTATSTATLTKTLKELGYTVADSVTRSYNGTSGLTAEIKPSTFLDSSVAGAWTGNGNVVELYDTDNNKVIDTVVAIAPVFGTVTTTSYPATNARGAYTVYSTSVGNGTVYTTVVNAETEKDTATVVGEVKSGDMVLSYKDTKGNLHIEAVSTVTGTLTAVNSKNVATIDGKTYPIAAAAIGTIKAEKDANTYYVDSYGNILGAVSAAAPSYAIVLKTESYAKLDGNKVVDAYSAMLAYADGTTETVDIDKASYGTVKAGWAVTYSVKNGVTTLSGLSSAEVTARHTEVTSLTTNYSVIGTGNCKYVNANTKFVVATYTKNASGEYEVTGSTLYTGIGSVPSYASLSNAKALDTSVTPDGIADLLVILDNKSATVTDNYVYVTSNYTETVDGRVYSTFVKGAESTLTVPTGTVINAGIYKSVASNGTTESAGTPATSVQNKGGLLFLNDTYAGKTITADTPVYIIDATTYTVSASATTAGAILTNAVSGNVYVVDGANNTTTAVYIVLK